MTGYGVAWDALASTIGAAKGISSGTIDDIDHMTVEQRLKVAEVAALLAIAEELSAVNSNIARLAPNQI